MKSPATSLLLTVFGLTSSAPLQDIFGGLRQESLSSGKNAFNQEISDNNQGTVLSALGNNQTTKYPDAKSSITCSCRISAIQVISDTGTAEQKGNGMLAYPTAAFYDKYFRDESFIHQTSFLIDKSDDDAELAVISGALIKQPEEHNYAHKVIDATNQGPENSMVFKRNGAFDNLFNPNGQGRANRNHENSDRNIENRDDGAGNSGIGSKGKNFEGANTGDKPGYKYRGNYLPNNTEYRKPRNGNNGDEFRGNNRRQNGASHDDKYKNNNRGNNGKKDGNNNGDNNGNNNGDNNGNNNQDKNGGNSGDNYRSNNGNNNGDSNDGNYRGNDGANSCDNDGDQGNETSSSNSSKSGGGNGSGGGSNGGGSNGGGSNGGGSNGGGSNGGGSNGGGSNGGGSNGGGGNDNGGNGGGRNGGGRGGGRGGSRGGGRGGGGGNSGGGNGGGRGGGSNGNVRNDEGSANGSTNTKVHEKEDNITISQIRAGHNGDEKDNRSGVVADGTVVKHLVRFT